MSLTIFGICIGGFWICIEGFRPSNLTMKVLNPGHFKPRDHQGPGGSEAKKARFFNQSDWIIPMIWRVSLKYTKITYRPTWPKHFMGDSTLEGKIHTEFPEQIHFSTSFCMHVPAASHGECLAEFASEDCLSECLVWAGCVCGGFLDNTQHMNKWYGT